MAALLVAMTGCQKEPQQNAETTEGGEVYMSFSVQAVSKSSTDATGESNSNANPEIEVGKDVENKISSVQVFLQDGTNTIKATNVNLVGGGVNYTATFEEEKIYADTEYSIYVICNESESINNPNADISVKSILGWNGTELNISKDNNFLMTNAKKVVPIKVSDEQLKASMSPATPLNLGTIEVERTVARFDYAQVKTGHLYEVAGNDVKIYLSEAAVINVSKESYYFRRVAATETGADFVVGGVEGPSNYVVDTDWEAKAELTTTWANTSAVSLFHSPLFNRSTWNWIDLTALSTTDNLPAVDGKNYNFLSYVSENTLPGVDAQINGLTTGVVFKGYFHNGTAKINGTENLYVYANKYYGDWDQVTYYAELDNNAALTAAYNAVSDPTNLAECANAGFTVYTPDADGNYPVYYYYWNRHNDNGNPNKMGIMEYAVVRNNVYKLAVTNISKFGHPDKEEGDPDDKDNDTPDEEERYYFQVSVKVLPWTVRVNDIEF